ncbi:MAG TPA: hypothetical protein PKH39_19580, partial [Woeseiaceae bacterium]|nr:hypothetical protein [Woeseiaceae bacterium]
SKTPETLLLNCVIDGEAYGVFKLSDGRVIRRTELSNGSIVETDAFAADFEPVTGKANQAGEIELQPIAKPAPIAPRSQ